jgi:dephospho-CoA kinase
VLLVGLTGGIGSGKSTVSAMLAEHGAVVLDADAFARDAVRIGTPAHDRVVQRFGPGAVLPDGELDRHKLAAIVFADEASRRDLEAIVHPEVRRRVAQEIRANADTSRVVVLESPLLIEMGQDGLCDVVVVVAASPDEAIARLVARGMREADARARQAAQLPVQERAKAADVLLDNGGDRQELRAQVDRLWADLAARAGAGES